MKRLRSLSRAVGLLALGLAWVGCKQPDSILFVTVSAPLSVLAVQLGVTVTVGGVTENIAVPTAKLTGGETINWPASFTIAVDQSYSPPIIVSINAYDDGGSIVGFGTTMMQHIHLGGQTDIAVQLMEGLPPDMPDAGTGGSGGNGGPGGAGGTSGSDGGAGAGPGDASGKEGGGDAEDASGLDAATE